MVYDISNALNCGLYGNTVWYVTVAALKYEWDTDKWSSNINNGDLYSPTIKYENIS